MDNTHFNPSKCRSLKDAPEAVYKNFMECGIYDIKYSKDKTQVDIDIGVSVITLTVENNTVNLRVESR